MTAAVLFRQREPIANGATETLWHNLDQGNNLGWGIFIEGNVLEGHTILTTALGDGVGQNPVNTDLGPGPISKLSLVHLVASDATGERRIFYNGALIDVQPMANPTLASAGQPVIGDLVGVGAPAANIDIIGVGYFEAALPDAGCSAHFRACFRGGNFARLVEWLPTALNWTNRWDVREGAVVAGAQGTLDANGNLLTLPAPADPWAPSDGIDDLTRVGALEANVLTCPPWGYSSAETGGGAANTFIQNFVDGDLVAGVLTVNHNLNSNPVSVTVRDNNGDIVVPDAVTMVTVNQITVDLTSFGVIAGTWSVFVVGQ